MAGDPRERAEAQLERIPAAKAALFSLLRGFVFRVLKTYTYENVFMRIHAEKQGS